VTDTETAAGNPSPATLLSDYQPAETAPILAVRLSGLFPSAFPNGSPSAASRTVHLASSQQSGDVVIIADADWLDDPYFLREDASFGLSIVADNPALLLNFVDLALGDPALLQLRSLPSSSRPMSRVDALRFAAEAEYADEQAALESRTFEIQAQLDALLSGRPPVDAPASDATLESRVAALRSEMTTARERLRAIERDFRENIDALEASLRFWTMWMPPILILLTGFGIGFWRRRRTLS